MKLHYMVYTIKAHGNAITDIGIVEIPHIHADYEKVEFAPHMFGDHADAMHFREQIRMINCPSKVLSSDAKTNRTRQRVKNNTTGVIYESASAAARAMEVSPNTMSLHLKYPSQYQTVKGYVFQRETKK